MTFNPPTYVLEAEDLARIIEFAFDHGWEHGRDTGPGELGWGGALANAKWQIEMWMADNAPL